MSNQLITPRILGRMRTLNEQLMPDTCTIHRATTTVPANVKADGSNLGEEVTVAGATLESQCRVSALDQMTEAEMAGRLEGVMGYAISLPWNIAISENDTIFFGGKEFQILGVQAPKSYQSAVRCICKKLT